MMEGFTGWPETRARTYRERGYWKGRTLGSALHETALTTPDAVALVDGGRRWSYADLDLAADRQAAGLYRLGLRAGDRVLVQMPNSAEFVVLSFALFRLGAVPVMALPAHREADLRHLADLSEAVAFAVADTHAGFDYLPLARTLLDRAPSLEHVLVHGDAAEFTDLAEVYADREPPAGPAASDVALLLLSGGTTGAPKLIPRTHDDYLYNATASARVAGVDAHTRYLAVLPVAHNFPLACPGILGTLFSGGTVVLCPHPSPDAAFPLIAAERVTSTALVPSLVLLWLEAVEWSDDDLSSLDLLQVGGAKLKSEVAVRVAPALGCRLQQVFGMAEGLVNYTRLDDPEDLVLHTQGRPLSPDDEVRVVGPDGAEAAAGEIGELQVRGPYTLCGYYRAEEHNATAFTEDGFFRSGDLVRRLPSGHLVVEGRTKEVINRAGEKIPVEEVENDLLSLPAVSDVALLPLPDASLGERSCACLIVQGEPPTYAEVSAHLRGRGLARFKIPDEVRVLRALPRTPLGKVDKNALLRQLSAHEQAL
ncbi:(2,3-dihydroxybenzoyl)adenylate synthase [Streptomyces sulphureus]|uniref:(2,3-dihydroxybenzoyl)adenylate synthase n=1 Tax=Streptomyces sulphureus TaxID=47758 RepID=UPI000475AD26|nr:AMP-binding protein [Streptomyces sulphureus]